MTSTETRTQDLTNDFDAGHVLDMADTLDTDYFYLFSEEWARGVVDKFHPDVSRLWDELEEANSRFWDYPGLRDQLHKRPIPTPSDLDAAFPPSKRPELEALVADVVSAFRAYREALWTAVQRRLTRTAVVVPTSLGAHSKAIAEAVSRLAADRQNLSDAVAKFCGQDGFNNPDIHELWSEADKKYLELRQKTDPHPPRPSSAEIDSDHPTPQTVLSPTEAAEVLAEIESTNELFQSVQAALLSAIEDELALSVCDYDPNWASHKSPVIFDLRTTNASA